MTLKSYIRLRETGTTLIKPKEDIRKEEMEDLGTLDEIFDAIGFGTSLTDGTVNIYSFNDQEIGQAYREIDKNVRLIKAKYSELQNRVG